AVLVENAPADRDTLADRIAPVLAREVVVRRLDVAVAEHRTRDFRDRLWRQHQRLRRATLLGRGVRRIVVIRLRAGVELAIADHGWSFHSASGCLEGCAR